MCKTVNDTNEWTASIVHRPGSGSSYASGASWDVGLVIVFASSSAGLWADRSNPVEERRRRYRCWLSAHCWCSPASEEASATTSAW
jgi:hypothetical protein